MASERLKRRIDGLLDEVEAAVSQLDWLVVRDRTQAVLALDPENADAATFLAAAERALSASVSIQQPLSSESPSALSSPSSRDLPGSFSNGRYEVQRFLGEGGKKRVYFALDTLLDREVAFALIKTEGLDDVARTRAWSREMYPRASPAELKSNLSSCLPPYCSTIPHWPRPTFPGQRSRAEKQLYGNS